MIQVGSIRKNEDVWKPFVCRDGLCVLYAYTQSIEIFTINNIIIIIIISLVRNGTVFYLNKMLNIITDRIVFESISFLAVCFHAIATNCTLDGCFLRVP